MEPSTKFEVLRIPADGSGSELINLDVHLFQNKISMQLQYPYLWYLMDEEEFKTQLKTPHHRVYRNENFCMYKCASKTEMNLPENLTFEHVKNARVYGDAFIFQLPRIELDKDGTQVYVALDLKEFAQSFKEKGEA